ncbi:C6 zinc finger domain protein [Colletotrichum higginsianum IMI 349063]|uniref:C6 zinc finger domain protein n=1 Tax=Colletotrichum higginsianum (strain IMI 349063) TaxID=759273 RepID=A0A1B7Y151_COLHI|nr:C6 zinc finger domain protein [Colletotrichum higginsianum IMI 349063]OBR05736.1 C6 zinc finger domain protein [Colletotrichum higginsianum IMI 349063]GJD03983.1 C6 zinc finger domain protein [Colletotrichum higginsianum]
MGYIPGASLNKIWDDLSQETRQLVTSKTADLMYRVPSEMLIDMPPDPVDAEDEKSWQGSDNCDKAFSGMVLTLLSDHGDRVTGQLKWALPLG